VSGRLAVVTILSSPFCINKRLVKITKLLSFYAKPVCDWRHPQSAWLSNQHNYMARPLRVDGDRVGKQISLVFRDIVLIALRFQFLSLTRRMPPSGTRRLTESLEMVTFPSSAHSEGTSFARPDLSIRRIYLTTTSFEDNRAGSVRQFSTDGMPYKCVAGEVYFR